VLKTANGTLARGWLSGYPALDAMTPATLWFVRAIPIATRAPPDMPARYTRWGSIEKRRLTSVIIACAAAMETA
jgi:hypothetical protein